MERKEMRAATTPRRETTCLSHDTIADNFVAPRNKNMHYNNAAVAAQ